MRNVLRVIGVELFGDCSYLMMLAFEVSFGDFADAIPNHAF